MKLQQKLLYKWEQSVNVFFLLGPIAQLMIGSAIAIFVLVCLTIRPESPAPDGMKLFVLGVALILYLLGTTYSLLFVVLSRISYFNKIAAFRASTMFHICWLFACSIVFLIAQANPTQGVYWPVLVTLSISWALAMFFHELREPLSRLFHQVVLLVERE